MDHWFHINFKNTNLYCSWEAGLQLLVDKIDPKYFVYELDQPVGLIQIFSPHYYIGDSQCKSPPPIFKNRNYQEKMPGNTILVKDKKITQYKF